MLKKVRLFILGMEADLDKEPEILFNYAIDDLTNPTVVKNSFSKSLTLLGTPAMATGLRCLFLPPEKRPAGERRGRARAGGGAQLPSI